MGDEVALVFWGGVNYEEFVNYFYLANLFLFPFSFIQSYIGFKEIVVMKKEDHYNLLKASSRVLLFALIFAVLLFGIINLLAEWRIIKVNIVENKSIILLFLTTGILRLNYAIFSAYFSCFASVRILKRANIVSLSLLTIFVVLVYKYNDSVIDLAIFLCAIWTARILTWAYFAHIIQVSQKINKN